MKPALSTAFAGVHPALKTILFLAMIIAVLFVPVYRLARSLPLLCALILLPLISSVSIRKLVRGILQVFPLIVLLALSRLLIHHRQEAAWHFALIMLLKTSAVLFVTFIWSALLSIQELAALLRQYRMPQSFTAVLFFGLRYFGLFAEEMTRFGQALASRAPMRLGWRRRIRVVMHGAAQFFLRAFSRSERIYAAMLARGFSGSLVMLPLRSLRIGETLAVLALSAVILGVTLWI